MDFGTLDTMASRVRKSYMLNSRLCFSYLSDKLTPQMPAELESPKQKALAWNWSGEPVRRKPWRPTTLTIRLFLRICHLVEQGSAITHACEAESVTYSHFRFRVSRSPRLQERLKQAETVRVSFCDTKNRWHCNGAGHECAGTRLVARAMPDRTLRPSHVLTVTMLQPSNRSATRSRLNVWPSTAV